MRKIGLVALLFAACGTKQPGVTIAITAAGFVKVDGKAVTLDGLATWLAARRDAAPLEEISIGKVSSLPVSLDVDDGALWGHVSWVMTVLAEQRFRRVSFPGGRETQLPVDCSLHGWPDEKALLVRVVALVDGAYALGDRTTRDIAEVGAWIEAASREWTLRRIGAVRARPRVTWQRVRPVFDLFSSCGFEHIDLWEPRIPSRHERACVPLPKLRTQPYLALPGVSQVGYWPKLGRFDDDSLWLSPSPEEEFAALIDGHRIDLDLPRFGTEEPLWKAARLQANEMNRLGYFGHYSPVPGNRSPSDRLAKFGWPEERRHAELLAKAETAEAAFDAILKNPENAAALADPAFEYAGVARSGDCWVVLLGAQK